MPNSNPLLVYFLIATCAVSSNSGLKFVRFAHRVVAKIWPIGLSDVYASATDRANVASNITSFRVPDGAITLPSPMATRDLRLRDKPGVPPSRLCLSIDCVWSATRVVCTVSVGHSLC